MWNEVFGVRYLKIRCKLKVIFAERNIKHGEFADKVGVSQATMSALVNERNLPTLPVAYRISEELGFPVEEIWVKEEL